MASSFHLQTLQSHFLGQKKFSNSTPKSIHKIQNTPTAKLDLSQVLGGRGLCNGEEGLLRELKKNTSIQIEKTTPPSSSSSSSSSPSTSLSSEEKKTRFFEIPESGFEKELLGLTGGFPGGETGLLKFVETNPPPKEVVTSGSSLFDVKGAKAKAPEMPLLLPGMIAIVKNPNNPFHMYCGIVQRITDGKAGVLFEGGNWDKLVTFRLEELERREKGPPMVNPRSAILEEMVENSS